MASTLSDGMLATQVLVVFIIRTQHVPFYKSKPSLRLILSVAACLFIGWLLPYIPFAQKIGFEKLPLGIVAYIVVLVVIYLITAELVKRFIYRKKEVIHLHD